MLSTIIQVIAKWATSFTGILTIMIIMITAIRLALTSVREKYGKESRRYCNMKLISGVAYLIVVINVISILIRSHISGLWGFLNQSLWYQCLAFITFYIAISSIAMKCLSAPLTIIANVALAFFGNYVDRVVVKLTPFLPIGIITVGISVIAFCIGLYMVEHISTVRNKAPKNNNTETVSPDLVSANFFARHGVIAAMLWIGSLVAAYLAGEYSLVPKAVEYIQSQFKKYSASPDQATTPETTDTDTTIMTIPTGTD